ncbi:cyclic AMP-responsive element-binding protein 5-like [Scylla paramamosain]|uniref:cyclic AMP-responsive element-binding protein 5-like n=1 Tax=Scylla paramamosain TaxID=85552 RepID=UPI003083CB5E
MKIAAVVAVVAGFCLLAVSGEPEPEAVAGYVGGHHSYHPVVVHPGHYGHNRYGRSAEPEPGYLSHGYGYQSRPYYHSYSHLHKRSADPEPEAEAEPGFRARGYGYQSRPYYHSYSHLHKRSAEPEADAEPGYPYGGSSQYHTPTYYSRGYGGYGFKASPTVQPM